MGQRTGGGSTSGCKCRNCRCFRVRKARVVERRGHLDANAGGGKKTEAGEGILMQMLERRQKDGTLAKACLI